MAEKAEKIIAKVAGKEFEFTGGGNTVGPNSVGSEEVVDKSIGKVDLDDEVNEGLDELNNVGLTDEELEDIFNNGSAQDTEEE